MARLDRVRLTSGVFPYVCEVPTRFTDIDVLGHVNNVAAAAIFQEARARFSHACGLVGVMNGLALVVASMTIEYADEMRHPDPVQVSVGLIELGRTSYRLGQVARQNGRIGAYAEIVQVASSNGASAPFGEAWRAKLESLKITYPG